MCTKEGSRHDAMGEVVIAPQNLSSTQKVISNHMFLQERSLCVTSSRIGHRTPPTLARWTSTSCIDGFIHGSVFRCVLILFVPSPKKLDDTFFHMYTFASSKHREHSCAVRISCRVGPDCVFRFGVRIVRLFLRHSCTSQTV